MNNFETRKDSEHTDVLFLQHLVSLMIPEKNEYGLPQLRVNDFLKYLDANEMSQHLFDILDKTKKLRLSMQSIEDTYSMTLNQISRKYKKEWIDLEKILTVPILNFYFSLNTTLQWLNVEDKLPLYRNISLAPFPYEIIEQVRNDSQKK